MCSYPSAVGSTMPPHASAARAARFTKASPSRPTVVGRLLRPCQKGGSGRRGRTRRGKRPHEEKDRRIAALEAGKYPTVGLAVNDRASAGQTTDVRAPSAWAWGSATPSPRLVGSFSWGPGRVPVARRFIAGSKPGNRRGCGPQATGRLLPAVGAWSAVSMRSFSTADRPGGD